MGVNERLDDLSAFWLHRCIANKLNRLLYGCIVRWAAVIFVDGEFDGWLEGVRKEYYVDE